MTNEGREKKSGISLGTSLQALGILWSIVAFVLGAVFFLGGEWNDWREIKHRVLEAPASDGPLLPGLEVSSRELTKLSGNLEVPRNRWDGEPTTIRAATDTRMCPEGWYVVGMRGVDTDGGKYCTSCISQVEFVCRRL